MAGLAKLCFQEQARMCVQGRPSHHYATNSSYKSFRGTLRERSCHLECNLAQFGNGRVFRNDFEYGSLFFWLFFFYPLSLVSSLYTLTPQPIPYWHTLGIFGATAPDHFLVHLQMGLDREFDILVKILDNRREVRII